MAAGQPPAQANVQTSHGKSASHETGLCKAEVFVQLCNLTPNAESIGFLIYLNDGMVFSYTAELKIINRFQGVGVQVVFHQSYL